MKKKQMTQKIIMFVLMIAILVWIVFFFKDIIIPFVRLEIKGNVEEAKQLLIDRGLYGYLSVALVPGLQMVVVFISAEFIQISAGLAYPWYIAAGLLDLGVIIGATIIWVLVHTFKIDTSMFNKSTQKIERYAKKSRNTQLFMFFLFFMPFIPYGAICYYGSSTKIRYGRYIITCALGCLPSIVTSILLGGAIKKFITEEMNIYLLIAIVIACAIILFVFIYFLLKKFIFKDSNGTPDSPLFSIVSKYSDLVCYKGKNLHFINQELLNNLEGPSIIISNHPGPYDYYRVYKLMDTPISCIVNKNKLTGKLANKFGREVGLIPKKIFDTDLEAAIMTKRMIRRGYSVYVLPEGRLSIDGSSFTYNENISSFVKKMNANLILVKIKKAYFSENIWRKKRFKTPIDVEVVEVIKKDDLLSYDVLVLDKKIKDTITCNDFDYVVDDYSYKQRNKAKGLENILYMCPHCGKLYTMRSWNNSLYCENCKAEYNIQDNYFFDSRDISTIHEFYDEIKNIEKANIKINNDVIIESDVKVKVFEPKSKKYTLVQGHASLTKKSFNFKTKQNDFSFSKSVDSIVALRFDLNKHFEMYYNEKLYQFQPTDKREVIRWALLVDAVKEYNNER